MKVNRKKAYMALALVIAIVLACGSVYAFMFSKTDKITNTFEKANVTCTVTEDFDSTNGIKKSIVVNNTGNIPAYIRVKIVANWVDQDGNIQGMPCDSPEFVLGNKWIKKGNTYYYTEAVAPGESTGNLLGADQVIRLEEKDEYSQSVDVLAEAVQSQPDNAVQEAWDVTVVNGEIK